MSVIFLTLFSLWAVKVQAEAWVIQPLLDLKARYDDNIRLVPDSESSVLETSAIGKARLYRLTENSEVSALAGIEYIYYTGDDDTLKDQGIQYGQLFSRWDTERTTWGVDGSYKRDSTLRTVDFTEESDVVDDPTGDAGDDIDAGLVRVQIRRNRLVVNPYASQKISERLRAQLDYRFQAVRYGESAESAGLQDSNYHGVSLELRRIMAEQHRARISARVTRLEPEIDEETNTFQLQAGWDYRLSPIASVRLEVGIFRAEQAGVETTGSLYRLSGQRRTAAGRMYGSIERQLQPDGSGELQETDQIIVGIQHKLGPRMAFDFRGRAFQTNAVGELERDRVYASIEPELSWSLSRWISLGTSYRYRWSDREADLDSAQSNAISVFIRYEQSRPLD